jgi:hypothetical protein
MLGMQIIDSFTETAGHTTLILNPGTDLEDLMRKVIDVLEIVWMADIVYDDDIEEYKEALGEFGIDLEQELRSRGLDEPLSKKRDRLIKDRGDIGEVLGYLRETLIRGVSQTEIFVPLIWAKLKGGVTTHGLDGICFVWAHDKEPDRMILCEWKHTSITNSVQAPCSRAADEWNSLTFRKLIQELRRVRRIYVDRSEKHRANRTKWFAHYWLNQDSRVTCTTMVVCPDAVPVQRACDDVSAHLVQTCSEHSSNPTIPSMHEASIIPLPDRVVPRQIAPRVREWSLTTIFKLSSRS